MAPHTHYLLSYPTIEDLCSLYMYMCVYVVYTHNSNNQYYFRTYTNNLIGFLKYMFNPVYEYIVYIHVFWNNKFLRPKFSLAITLV